MNDEKIKVLREVDYRWDRLMTIAQVIKYGKCVIVLENGEPVRIERPLQTFDLKISDKDFEDRLKTISI